MPKNIQTTTQLHSFHIQVIKVFSCIVHLCILVTSSWYLLLLLGPYHFYPLLCPYLCMKYSLSISNFLKEISSLSHSIVLLYFFVLFTEEGFLISPCYSLELYIQLVYLFLYPLPFTSLLSSGICKASSDNHFAFLHFWEDGFGHHLLYNFMNLCS